MSFISSESEGHKLVLQDEISNRLNYSQKIIMKAGKKRGFLIHFKALQYNIGMSDQCMHTY